MMTDWPLVSIVTPVFNGAETIQRTIDSIRQQDYPHIEHVVMDGGSKDGTLDILRANEEHLTWYSEPDNGQSDAINNGFARTSGTLLNWLNADDFLLPGAIRRCVEVLRANPGVGLVYGRINLVHKDGSFWRDDHNVREGTRDDLLRGDTFLPQAGDLFTREAWEKCGPLDVNLHYCMDWDLWIRIFANYDVKYIPEVFASQAVYPEAKSSSGGLPRFHEIRQMIERNGGSAAHTYYKIGLWHYQHNQMTEARHNFKIALSRGPSPEIRRRLMALIVKSYLGGRIVDLGRSVRRQIGL
jgi:glycosyltransferase involved in cell wall biosynthesis